MVSPIDDSSYDSSSSDSSSYDEDETIGSLSVEDDPGKCMERDLRLVLTQIIRISFFLRLGALVCFLSLSKPNPICKFEHSQSIFDRF